MEYNRRWRERNRELVERYNLSRRTPPARLLCSECGGEFFGRKDRKTCSDVCRRRRKVRLDPRWAPGRRALAAEQAQCRNPTKNYARRCAGSGRCTRSFPRTRQPGFDPPPHATLGRYQGPTPITFEQAKARVERLLPVHCVITEATLQEEYEPDRMRIRETFPFAGASG